MRRTFETYRDGDALAFEKDTGEPERASTNYVAKRNKSSKGLEVAFDDSDRTEYLSGFRKRKLQRRKDALKKIEKKEREGRLQHRAENRQQFKDRLGLPENYGVAESDDEAAAPAPPTVKDGDVKVYDFEDVTTTVTTIDMNSDDEPGASDGDDNDDDDAAPQAGQAAAAASQQQPASKHRQPAVNHSTLMNLKARIAGRKKKRQGKKSDKADKGPKRVKKKVGKRK
jgi:ribosomal RNA-processing protein 17